MVESTDRSRANILSGLWQRPIYSDNLHARRREQSRSFGDSSVGYGSRGSMTSLLDPFRQKAAQKMNLAVIGTMDT